MVDDVAAFSRLFRTGGRVLRCRIVALCGVGLWFTLAGCGYSPESGLPAEDIAFDVVVDGGLPVHATLTDIGNCLAGGVEVTLSTMGVDWLPDGAPNIDDFTVLRLSGDRRLPTVYFALARNEPEIVLTGCDAPAGGTGFVLHTPDGAPVDARWDELEDQIQLQWEDRGSRFVASPKLAEEIAAAGQAP